MAKHKRVNPRDVDLAEWLRLHEGLSSTGTFTFSGVVYTDIYEVAWRQANRDFKTPRPAPAREGGDESDRAE